MRLKLKIASGPLQGREFPLAAGGIIGRSSAEITINDPKISGRHAKVELGPTGELLLIDLGSSNGLRVQDKKLTQVTLSPGLSIRIGSTLCEVLLDQDGSAAPPTPPLPHDEQTLPPLRPRKEMGWSEYFSDFILRSLAKIKNRPQQLLPFKPLVVLTITHGLQAGTEWTLGYGPRFVGPNSLDFAIFDSGVPPLAFKIAPAGSNAMFETEHPEKVRLNGRVVSSEKLRPGDEIAFANTRIKVSFI